MTQMADRWVAIGVDSQVQPKSSNPVIVDDMQLAMWRPESGPVRVWEDRCPHRGMRLSFGFVDGDNLRCIYHGWAYAPDGPCVSIPAHPDLTPPKTICANTFPAAVRFGLVWTNLNQSPESAPPEESGDWTAIRSIFVDRSEDEVRPHLAAYLGREAGAGEGALIRGTAPSGEELVFAVQKLDAGRTAFHAAAALGDGATTEARLALIEALEGLRAEIEAA